jgi:hypothetical protein
MIPSHYGLRLQDGTRAWISCMFAPIGLKARGYPLRRSNVALRVRRAPIGQIRARTGGPLDGKRGAVRWSGVEVRAVQSAEPIAQAPPARQT